MNERVSGKLLSVSFMNASDNSISYQTVHRENHQDQFDINIDRLHFPSYKYTSRFLGIVFLNPFHSTKMAFDLDNSMLIVISDNGTSIILPAE